MSFASLACSYVGGLRAHQDPILGPWPWVRRQNLTHFIIGKVLYNFFYKLCLKIIDHGTPGPRSSRIQINSQKMFFTLNKTLVCYIFGFIKFSWKHKVKAAEPTQSHFRPPYPWFRVMARSRRSRPDQVDYWKGALQLLYNKLSLKMIDHGSRSTWGPGPSRSRLQAHKHDGSSLKQDCPTTFVL